MTNKKFLFLHLLSAFATSSTGYDYRDGEIVDFGANTTYSGVEFIWESWKKFSSTEWLFSGFIHTQCWSSDWEPCH